MSIRPRPQAAQAAERARSRMAPGGRLWSESPIPRVAPRRVRMVGRRSTLVVAGANAYAPGITAGYSEPPATQYMTQAGAGFPELNQGEAVVVLVAGYALGTITLPTGWTTADSGTIGSTPLQYVLCWATDADAPVGDALTYSAWDTVNSAAIVSAFYFTSADPYEVDPLPAWSLDLQHTKATATGANSIAAEIPSTSWQGRFNVTAGLVENATATSYPYVSTDPTIDYTGLVGVSDGLGGADRLSVVHPYDGDHTPLATPTEFQFANASALGAWVSFGIGWA